MLSNNYHTWPAAAFVISQLSTHAGEILQNRSISELSESEIESLIQLGRDYNLKLYRFKKTMGLPRVSKVLGYLKAFYPQKLLDIGTGRGVFLWPFMDEFPHTEVTSIDILTGRIEFLKSVRTGGMEKLDVGYASIVDYDSPDCSFDAVTFLETLEHIPEAEKSLLNALRMARYALIITVPSREDDNPEHIHLLKEDFFKSTLSGIPNISLSFDYVHNHMIVIVNKK